MIKKSILLILVLLFGCKESSIDTKYVKNTLKNLKEVKISPDYSKIPEDVQKALPYIKNAMDIVDELFILQLDPNLKTYIENAKKENNKYVINYLKTFKAPWNHYDHFKSIDKNFNNKLAGGNFYPTDLTKEEFDKFLKTLSAEEKDKFLDPNTVIRRNGKLQAIYYHIFYKEYLIEIHDNLIKAASFIKNEKLKNYLEAKAKSLIDGNQRYADSLWVELKETPIDLVIGPYEVYADEFYGVKAAYEAMLIVIDHEKQNLLKTVENNIQNFAKVFPVPSGSKSAIGKLAPIIIGDEIYTSGDGYYGVFHIAFNLPNDPWIRQNKGWKQVMVQNMMRAKFENISIPIAKRVLESSTEPELEPFFYFIMFHEISHALGPAYRANGIGINKSLGAYHTPIEEAKADTGSMFLIRKLRGQYGIPDFDKEELLKSFLAGMFRSIRFGVHEAHGKSNLIQLNWYKKHNVIEVNKNGKYIIHAENFDEINAKLLNKLTELQAVGTEKNLKEFLDEYGKVTEDLTNILDSIKDIPTDIRVIFSL
jgi:hypothetical protein